jgi:hypothetical protein
LAIFMLSFQPRLHSRCLDGGDGDSARRGRRRRALALRGMPFTVSAAIGFVALSGVAILNGSCW